MSSRPFLLCPIAPALYAQAHLNPQVRAAVGRSIPVIQRAAAGFFKNRDCASCHHHILPVLTVRLARERGVPVDETAARDAAAKGAVGTGDAELLKLLLKGGAQIDEKDQDQMMALHWAVLND